MHVITGGEAKQSLEDELENFKEQRRSGENERNIHQDASPASGYGGKPVFMGNTGVSEWMSKMSYYLNTHTCTPVITSIYTHAISPHVD